MSAYEQSKQSVAVPLSVAAARYTISPQTLRRLCDSGQLPCEKDSRGWRVPLREVETYLLARRPPGRQDIALWLQGPATNPRQRDGVGWMFKALGRGGRQFPIEIWFSNELVEMLQQEGHDVRDVLVRSAERLVEDSLLDTDELRSGQEILYGRADRSFIVRAAGYADETYLPSEAPPEIGVSVLYELSARDFAQDGLWPGDAIEVDSIFEDVVVDVQPEGGVRRVRSVRMPVAVRSESRRSAIQNAIRSYDERCRNSGLAPGGWTAQVATRAHVLTTAQQRVLELAHSVWSTQGEWPTYSWVQTRMDQEYDTDLADVLADYPPGLIWGLRPHSPHLERVVLTVAGLAHCSGAAGDVALFLEVVTYLVQRRRNFVPSPTETESLIVTSAEVMQDLPAATAAPARAIQRLFDFLQQDFFLTQGGGRQADGTWNVVVGPESRRYRGVADVETYLSRQQPNATPWDDPAAASRPRLRPVKEVVAPPSTEDPTIFPDRPTGHTEVFALMPFASDFDDVWHAIRSATTGLDISCGRADTIHRPGRITQQIVEAIRAATVVVADVTDNNPNVMFELGFADALGKPIVVLNRRIANAPFDIKDWRQIEYSLADLNGMSSILREFLRQVMLEPRKGAGVETPPQFASPPPERPLLEVRGASVPGDSTGMGEIHLKNVGTKPAVNCRAIIRGQASWFVGGPNSVGPSEDLRMQARATPIDLPPELAPVGGQTVLYEDLQGWVYRATQGGLTEAWVEGQPPPTWVNFFRELSAAGWDQSLD